MVWKDYNLKDYIFQVSLGLRDVQLLNLQRGITKPITRTFNTVRVMNQARIITPSKGSATPSLVLPENKYGECISCKNFLLGSSLSLPLTKINMVSSYKACLLFK